MFIRKQFLEHKVKMSNGFKYLPFLTFLFIFLYIIAFYIHFEGRVKKSEHIIFILFIAGKPNFEKKLHKFLNQLNSIGKIRKYKKNFLMY